MTCPTNRRMKILGYSEIDRNEWSRLVASSPTGTWFQMPEAYDFYASQPDLFKPFVVAISNEAPLSEAQHSINPSLQTLRAVCVGYVTKEKNPIKQYFTRRAIIVGGPCLADDCTAEEVDALMNAVKNLPSLQGRDGERLLSPIYIETRNFSDYSRWKGAFEKAGFEYKKHLNFHVDCTDKEKMWERLSETRRRQIRKVTNEGVKEFTNERVKELVSEGVSEQDVREWYEILSELYRTKVKTPLWPVEFFIEAYRKGIGQFMLVRHEGKVIGGSMVVRDEKTVYEWFECGLNAEYKELYPSVMATYAGIKYAAEHGYARYDMMGAGEPGVPYGVRDFKAEFGGEMVEQGRFLCICHPFLYRLGVLGVKILRKS
jgi:hypothetical protein